MSYQGYSRGGGRRPQIIPAEDDQLKKIFIGGLSYETTDEGLKEYFGRYGEIKDCVVMKDPGTKRSRGFGFITFEKSSQLEDCQKARPHKIDGREVDTKRAMPREYNEAQQSTEKMFMGGLPQDVGQDDIKALFHDYGDIVSVDLIRDKATDKLKGFGFVTFSDTDSVDKCVIKKYFTMKGKTVEVKRAVKGEQRGEGGRGGGRGGTRGGRGGGRGGGGGGGGGFNDWNQGGGFNQGGYSQGNYGNGYGNQGGGGYGNNFGNQGWNQGGGGGAASYDYSGGYSNQGGTNNYGGSFGQNYGENYGGGAMKNTYSNRGQGPYGSSGYNSGGYSRR